MEMSLRSSAAWLSLIAACSGPTFTAGQPNAGGQGSQSGATMTGGKDGAGAGEGGGPEAPSDGGAAGAGGSSETGTAGQGVAGEGGANGLGEGGASPVCAASSRRNPSATVSV